MIGFFDRKVNDSVGLYIRKYLAYSNRFSFAQGTSSSKSTSSRIFHPWSWKRMSNRSSLFWTTVRSIHHISSSISFLMQIATMANYCQWIRVWTADRNGRKPVLLRSVWYEIRSEFTIVWNSQSHGLWSNLCRNFEIMPSWTYINDISTIFFWYWFAWIEYWMMRILFF